MKGNSKIKITISAITEGDQYAYWFLRFILSKCSYKIKKIGMLRYKNNFLCANISLHSSRIFKLAFWYRKFVSETVQEWIDIKIRFICLTNPNSSMANEAIENQILLSEEVVVVLSQWFLPHFVIKKNLQWHEKETSMIVAN